MKLDEFDTITSDHLVAAIQRNWASGKDRRTT